MVTALGSLKLPPTGKFEMNEWQGTLPRVIYIKSITPFDHITPLAACWLNLVSY